MKSRRASSGAAAPHKGGRQPAKPSMQSAAHPITPRRQWLFRFVAAVGIPALVLGFLELALRILDYGYPTSFFVKSPIPGQNTMVENRQFSRPYFSSELMRIPAP